MKKVLCGLVIALMMTGNGFAREFNNVECLELIEDARTRVMNINFAKIQESKKAEGYAIVWSAMCSDRYAKGIEFKPAECLKLVDTIQDDYKNKLRKIINGDSIRILESYSIVWSIMCDDMEKD